MRQSQGLGSRLRNLVNVESREKGMDRLLSVDQAAEVFGTSAQFPRKLIAQRRIGFVRVGRLVRIPESVIREYIETQTVEPIASRRGRRVA
jgi:excisionase family DNA binding protein